VARALVMLPISLDRWVKILVNLCQAEYFQWNQGGGCLCSGVFVKIRS
jgi:hypothetical protein